MQQANPSAEEAQGTDALIQYLDEDDRLFGLVLFVGGLIVRADQSALIAAKALIDGARDEDERKRYSETIERGGAGVGAEMQDRYAVLFTRLVVQRTVDNFLAYLADLLKVVFSVRPEALRTGETVRVEAVLQHDSLEELIAFLVERRVDRLAFQSLRDLCEDVKKTLGLALFDTEEDMESAVRAIATRNVLVHNRGIINGRFIRDVPTDAPLLGKRVKVGHESLFPTAAFLRSAALRIDADAVQHFGLPTSDVAGTNAWLET